MKTESPHIVWLICLDELMRKVRKHGLLAIEADIEVPDSENGPFSRNPLLMQQPYQGFARDLFRLCLGGLLEDSDLDVYAQEAMTTLTRHGVDASILRTIWLTIRSFSRGRHPSLACEFGRQAIPVEMRPNFNTLENILAEARRVKEAKSQEQAGGARDLEAEAERFIASISGE